VGNKESQTGFYDGVSTARGEITGEGKKKGVFADIMKKGKKQKDWLSRQIFLVPFAKKTEGKQR